MWIMLRGMKMLLLIVMAFILSRPARAESRTFTNTKGEEIKAEMISATESRAELKRADGKTFSVALSSLSEADRKWIAEWRKHHKHFKIAVLANVKKSISREEKGGAFDGKSVKGNDCWYILELKNNSPEPLAGLRVDYILFSPVGASVSGSSDVSPIPAGKAGQAVTPKLFVEQKQSVTRSGGTNVVQFSEGSLAGLRAELFVDGKPAGAFLSGKLPADAEAQLQKWRDAQPKTPPAEKSAAPQPPAEKKTATLTWPLVATFSIVARDPATGELGVAVQSRVLGVGAIVPFAKAGVGAIATQSVANTAYGPDGLKLLADGKSAEDALKLLTEADDKSERRQAGIIAPSGKPATFTGSGCMAWAGGRAGEHYAVQGNILAGEAVVSDMAKAFESATGALGERMLAALEAGQKAGGDKRGMQSAALLVVHDGWGYGGQNDRFIDLRVDDRAEPIKELQRLYQLHTKTFPRPGK